MKTLLLLAALAFQDQAPLQWSLDPGVVQIGQPIRCTLEVQHPAGAEPEDAELDLDYGWEVIAGPDRRPIEGGTQLAWTVLALEPGELEFPGLDLGFGDGSRVLVGATTVEVHGDRAGVEDDLPRDLPGFRTTVERTSPVRPRHLLLGSMVLLLAAVTSFVFWRRSRRTGQEDTPTELERFRGLEFEEGDARPLAFELAVLLRCAADRRAGFDATREALTDDEWLEGLRERGSLEECDTTGLEGVLRGCATIKYAGARPTRFAVQDLLSRAEQLLVRLDQAPVEEELSTP
jgi:hypothetical protein